MYLIKRVRPGRDEYLGRRGLPVKSKRSARRFKTCRQAEAYLAQITDGRSDGRSGWFAWPEHDDVYVDPHP